MCAFQNLLLCSHKFCIQNISRITPFQGLGRLLRRLRRRYPHALIIYVELWSIYNNVAGKPTNHEITDAIRAVIDDVGVFHYMLKPYPSTVLPNMPDGFTVRNSDAMPSWVTSEPLVSELFTPDWHHLSQTGHRQVAEGVPSDHRRTSGGIATGGTVARRRSSAQV